MADIKTGDLFPSYNDFEGKLKQYKAANFVQFYISNSRTLEAFRKRCPILMGKKKKTGMRQASPQPENVLNKKQLSRESYHAAVDDELFKGKSLSKLLIDGFDYEQIWQQSNLLNRVALEKISDFNRIFEKDMLSFLSDSPFPKFSVNNEISKSSLKKHKNKSTNNIATDSSSEESNAEDYAFDDDSDSASELDIKLKETIRKSEITESASEDYYSDLPTYSKTQLKRNEFSQNKSEDSSDAANTDDSVDFDKKTAKKQLSNKESDYTSVVDDQFFKLSKLENFLRIEDLKEERGEDSALDDDKIDLFQDIPSDDISNEESEEEQDKTKKSARDLMYEDFFDDPESESENKNKNALNGQNEGSMEENEKYSFDGSKSGDEMEIGEKENDFKSEIQSNCISTEESKKTKFELEQEKTKKAIQECEKSMLQPLPWHLTGEVAADKRPVDSLLELEADFDCNTKQDLLVDKDLTEKIEEITIMAIRNKAFFDVERKFKPTEDLITYKKEAALEQTKSKKSLAEVYEEDYLKKQYKQDTEEEDPKHKEIKKLMDSLLPQLHALFSHIPKPAIPEIKIVSNLPAITVEEVAPTNVSDATLLAPEEVKKKTGLIKGNTERTDTDRKRERRKKKIHQRLKEKKKLEKLESQKENPSAKVSKLEKIQTLKKLKQHKNTKIASIDESGKIKSSKDFFSRLQDTMDTKNETNMSNKKIKNK